MLLGGTNRRAAAGRTGSNCRTKFHQHTPKSAGISQRSACGLEGAHRARRVATMPMDNKAFLALTKLDAMLKQKGMMAITLFRDRTFNTSVSYTHLTLPTILLV